VDLAVGDEVGDDRVASAAAPSVMCLKVNAFFVMSIEYGTRRMPKYPVGSKVP
jgi:hypothetical protein